MNLPLEALAIAAVLALPRESVRERPVEAREDVAVPTCRSIPWLTLHRTEIQRDRLARDATREIGVRLGAALAWDLADLPRHHSDRYGPLDAVRPGALFMSRLEAGTSAEGGAVGRLIARWNTLYPAFTLEGSNHP